MYKLVNVAIWNMIHTYIYIHKSVNVAKWNIIHMYNVQESCNKSTLHISSYTCTYKQCIYIYACIGKSLGIYIYIWKCNNMKYGTYVKFAK